MLSLASSVKAQLGTLPSEIPLQRRVPHCIPSFYARPAIVRGPRSSVALNLEFPEQPRPASAVHAAIAAADVNPEWPRSARLTRRRRPNLHPAAAARFIVAIEPQPVEQMQAAPPPLLPASCIHPDPLQLPPPAVSLPASEPLLLSAAVTETAAEAAPEPLSETAAEALRETAPEPVAEAAPEAIAETAPARVDETVSQAAAEPAVESAPEPGAQAAPEPTPEPMAVAPEPAPFQPALQTWTPPPPVARPLNSPPPAVIDLVPDAPVAPAVALPPPIEHDAIPASVAQAVAAVPPVTPVAQKAASRATVPGWLVSVVVATALSLGGAVIVRNMDVGHKAAAAAPAADDPAAPERAFAGAIEVTGLRVIADLKNGSRLHYVVVNHSGAQVSNAQLQISVRSGATGVSGAPLFTVSALVTGLAPYESREMVADIESLNTKEIPDWQFLRPEVHLLSQ
jgi:hypothetical protein